jgi:hypothetical protein
LTRRFESATAAKVAADIAGNAAKIVDAATSTDCRFTHWPILLKAPTGNGIGKRRLG